MNLFLFVFVVLLIVFCFFWDEWFFCCNMVEVKEMMDELEEDYNLCEVLVKN